PIIKSLPSVNLWTSYPIPTLNKTPPFLFAFICPVLYSFPSYFNIFFPKTTDFSGTLFNAEHFRGIAVHQNERRHNIGKCHNQHTCGKRKISCESTVCLKLITQKTNQIDRHINCLKKRIFYIHLFRIRLEYVVQKQVMHGKEHRKHQYCRTKQKHVLSKIPDTADSMKSCHRCTDCSSDHQIIPRDFYQTDPEIG